MPAVEIKPCPLCGCKLVEERDLGISFSHQNKNLDSCILSTLKIFPDELDLWNRRADTKEKEI